MGFSTQEYSNGLPFPPLGDLPHPGIKPVSPASSALAGRFFTTASQGCCCSVAKSRPTLSNPMDCSTPGFPVHHHLPEFAKIMSTDAVMSSNHLILCYLLLLLPSIFPSIRVFSKESALCIRWPKYWSFSFSISPSSKHSGLISFRIEWFDLLAIQGTLQSLFQHDSSKA